jgi:uncharacterized membrane protein
MKIGKYIEKYIENDCYEVKLWKRICFSTSSFVLLLLILSSQISVGVLVLLHRSRQAVYDLLVQSLHGLQKFFSCFKSYASISQLLTIIDIIFSSVLIIEPQEK